MYTLINQIHSPIISINNPKNLKIGDQGTITGVSQHSSAFLKHLEKLGLTLGKRIEISEIIDFDGSVELLIDDRKVNISKEVAKHILISK